MQFDISKICSDFLRSYVATAVDADLKATHAREIVAAYFGYNTHAAQLSENTYPLVLLDKVSVLVPDIDLIQRRLGRLEGLPKHLPSAVDLASAIGDFLIDSGHFYGTIWLYESLASYVVDVLLPEMHGDILNELSGVMAETNAYFDEAVYESAGVLDCGDIVQIEVTGQFNGTNDPDRVFYGDQIDMTVMVELYRVAGRTGFGDPDISASGEVNHDWVDPEFKHDRLEAKGTNS